MTDQYFTPSPSDDNCNFHTKSAGERQNTLVAVIAVGQNDVVFTVYVTPGLTYLLSTKQHLQSYSPQPGWLEQDPQEIMDAIYTCSTKACSVLPLHGYLRADIEAIGIVNHRDATLVWNACNGKPLYRAIIGNDRRTAAMTDEFVRRLPKQDQYHYKNICGLPVLPNLFAMRLGWLQSNINEVKKAMAGQCCKAGTLDSWIVWNLTNGHRHITDVTNASRTLLMNISTSKWDRKLLAAFSIDSFVLPEIRSSSEIFGVVTNSLCVLRGMRIGSVMGDQQACLVGEMCLHPGEMIANFDDSLYLLCNTGKKSVYSREIITTIAYKMDMNSPCVYALEAIVPHCGSLFNWMVTKVRILPSSGVRKAEFYAASVHSTNGLYFVPAFSGLQAPFWRPDARGILVGLTKDTNRSHVVRAAFEAICFQACDIIENIRQTEEFRQNVIYAGGIHALNDFLMQLFADIAGVMIVRYKGIDAISYGAAICAGRAVGAINLRHFHEGTWRNSIDYDTFVPYIKSEERMQRYLRWRQAVARSVNWLPRKKFKTFYNKKSKNFLLWSIPASMLVLVSVIILINNRR